LARGNGIDCIGRFAQRIDGVHVRGQLALRAPLQKLFGVGAVAGFVALDP